MLKKSKMIYQSDFHGIKESVVAILNTKVNSTYRSEKLGCDKLHSIPNEFNSLISKMSDHRFIDRLSKVMKKISSRKSPEVLMISSKRDYLYSLSFSSAVDFDNVVKTQYATAHNALRNSASLSFSTFNPLNSINAPAGATHFRLINALWVIADFKLNITAGTYEPIDAVNHEKNMVEYSSYLPISSFMEAQTVEVTLPYYPGLAENNSVIQCIGIEFYQQAGGEFYPFFSGNCLKVMDVF